MNDTDSPVVIRFTDPDAVDPDRTGGKGANLGIMVRAGLPVPAGFVVSTSAYRTFVRAHGLDARIAEEMARPLDDPAAVDAASGRLRRAFEAVEMPTRLREDITAAYRALGAGPVAVRSSATAEDLPGASFAGQQDTVLDVDADGLDAAVRRCWSSLWTARAIAYRHRQRIGLEGLAVAVVVQRMVPADVAGVLFTADPVSGRRDHTVIEAAAGLGEAVVGGRLTPDRWTVDTRTRAVLTGPHPAARSAPAAALSAEQLDTLVGLGRQATEVFGGHQDIEWAIADSRCWMLQSRPITSLFPLPPATQPGLRVYLPVMLAVQGITEPMTPAGNDFFRAVAVRWYRYLLLGSRRRPSDDQPPWLTVVAGRLFADVTALLQRPRVAARLVAGLRPKDPAASTTLGEWLARNANRLSAPRRSVPTPRTLAWLASLLAAVVTTAAGPARARRRLLAQAEDLLADLERRAAALTSPGEQVDFVARTLPDRTFDLVAGQLPAVYAEELLKLAAEGLARRWLGSTTDLEPGLRWLPHNPTTAMGAELARIADRHAAAGTEPETTGPELARFLADYGHRAPDREIDLGLPRFADDPTYVVELVRGYQLTGEPGRARARFAAGAEQARIAVAELVAAVRRVKGPVRARVLGSLLNRYRHIGGLRERPKFDMVRAIALARRTLGRAGATLAADDRLDHADDVFFLDLAAVQAALADPHRDLRAVVAVNRREYERELGRRAVPRVLVSDGEAVYGPEAQPAAGRADILPGTAISPGVHEGVVRVLDSPVSAGLHPGEVLVAASTDPGWTPLFMLAGALVMEVGGVVSHGAVVAREYGIPAVAGITDVTSRLRTGQRVRVDGSNGTVVLLGPDRDMPGDTRPETVRRATP